MWKLDIEDVAALERTEGRRLRHHTPDGVVSEALRTGCRSIASTYSEPTVSSEFSFDVFRLAKAAGLFTVYVTNGFESVETLNYLGPHLDAVNIDLKAFREPFYAAVCGAHLGGVCDTIRRCVAMGIHTEVTTLVIPGENDSDAELRDVAAMPSATKSITVTRSATESVTATPSATESVTATPSATESVTATPNATESVTATPSATESVTATPTATMSEQFTSVWAPCQAKRIMQFSLFLFLAAHVDAA
jgi:molybdenum cofactor biosynthesis enzyme MoaA